MKTVFTNCRICLPQCGIEVSVSDAGKIERIAPDKENPFTWRDFCPKGRTAAQVVEHPRRLLSPMRRVGDGYEPASWDEAIGDIASRLDAIRREHGPDAIAMYVGNPALLSSSNPLFAAGLMDGIGSRNRYSATSVDSNSWHVVSEELYGSPFFVLVPDIEDCRCFLLVGMNPAVSGMNWSENNPNGWRRVLAAQSAGADLIVVDPRRTPTAARADTHLAVRPGQDWALLLGLLKVIFAEGWEHAEDCAKLNGLGFVRQLAADADLDELALRCGIPVAQVVDVARRFAQAPTAMCISHTGVSQNEAGTLGEWLSHLLNLVTGRIDRPGGRRHERGYLDVMGLWARMGRPQTALSRVRSLPAVGGFYPVAELADEILTPGRGQIRAAFLNAGNPVVTGPDGATLDKALGELDLLVAVDLVQRESHRHADWLIPDVHFLEREDLLAFVSQSPDQPFVQFSPRAVAPPPDVREAWEFFTELALATRTPLFGYRGVNQFIKATRALAKVTRAPGLAFNPRWIMRLLVLSGRRLKWKDILAHPHGWIYGEKEFGKFQSALRTPDKRVNAAPPAFVAEARRLLGSPIGKSSSEYPLRLVSQRHRETMNSWLGEVPGLRTRNRHNEVEINPEDAAQLGIVTGDLVRVVSPSAWIELPAIVSDAIRPGCIAIEQGWGSRIFDSSGSEPPQVHGVNRNALVSSSILDPLSQMPALNSQAVRVELARAPARGAPSTPAVSRSV